MQAKSVCRSGRSYPTKYYINFLKLINFKTSFSSILPCTLVYEIYFGWKYYSNYRYCSINDAAPCGSSSEHCQKVSEKVLVDGLPNEKATPTMAMPRPLVAGVETSVMIAVDRDTFPSQRTRMSITWGYSKDLCEIPRNSLFYSKWDLQ
jgi:hypothetical protein